MSIWCCSSSDVHLRKSLKLHWTVAMKHSSIQHLAKIITAYIIQERNLHFTSINTDITHTDIAHLRETYISQWNVLLLAIEKKHTKRLTTYYVQNKSILKIYYSFEHLKLNSIFTDIIWYLRPRQKTKNISTRFIHSYIFSFRKFLAVCYLLKILSYC